MPDSPPYPNERLEFWLAHLGYPFTKGSRDDYRFVLKSTACHVRRAQVITYPESNVARLFVFLTDEQYLQTRRPFVRRLAAELTAELVFGAYVFTHNDGSVCYRDAEQIIDAESMLRLLNRASFGVDLWAPGYSCRDLPKVTPEAARRLALMFNAVDEKGTGIPSALMDGLLTVENGRGDVEQPNVKKGHLSLFS